MLKKSYALASAVILIIYSVLNIVSDNKLTDSGSVLDKAGVRIEPKIGGESIPLSVEELSKPNADETIEDLESSQIDESESSDEPATDEFKADNLSNSPEETDESETDEMITEEENNEDGSEAEDPEIEDKSNPAEETDETEESKTKTEIETDETVMDGEEEPQSKEEESKKEEDETKDTTLTNNEIEINTNDDSANKDEDKQRRKTYLDAFPVEYANSKNTDGQSFEDLQNKSNLDVPLPRNLSILFSGDSLTRYQYIDLAYFLAYGKWVHPDDKPNMEVETDHESWVSFYNYTNTMLQPYEECDCFREEGSLQRKDINENRFFLDKERNNSIAYLQKFGNWPYAFSWDVKDVHNEYGPLITERSQLKPKTWGHWVQAIKEFICMLEPKPSIFIFNEGIWHNNDLHDVQLQDDIIHALNECNIKSLYRTTTKEDKKRDSHLEEYELRLCDKTDHSMDVSWTGLVSGEQFLALCSI